MVTIYNHLAAIKCRRALTGLRVEDAPEDKKQTQNNPVLEDCVCVLRSLGHIKDYNSGQ